MSWKEQYVDQQLMNTGLFDCAAIVGNDGSVWGASDNFNVQKAEVDSLNRAFEADSPAVVLAPTGMVVGGKKYLFIKGDDTSLIGRKQKNQVSVFRGKTCMIIGVSNENAAGEVINTKVGQLCDYLKNLGF